MYCKSWWISWEVDAVKEMFNRQMLEVKYAYYIDDGDSKTFSSIR